MVGRPKDDSQRFGSLAHLARFRTYSLHRELELAWTVPNEFISLIKLQRISSFLPYLSVLSLERYAVGELLDVLGESVPHTSSTTDAIRTTDALLPELTLKLRPISIKPHRTHGRHVRRGTWATSDAPAASSTAPP